MFRKLFFSVLLLLFLVKSFVPIGFMPNISLASLNDPFQTIVICSGLEEKIILVDQDGNKVSQTSDHQTNKNICEFSITTIFDSTPIQPIHIETAIVSFNYQVQQSFASLVYYPHSYQSRAPPIVNV
jgi:hypothetical protein